MPGSVFKEVPGMPKITPEMRRAGADVMEIDFGVFYEEPEVSVYQSEEIAEGVYRAMHSARPTVTTKLRYLVRTMLGRYIG